MGFSDRCGSCLQADLLGCTPVFYFSSFWCFLFISVVYSQPISLTNASFLQILLGYRWTCWVNLAGKQKEEEADALKSRQTWCSHNIQLSWDMTADSYMKGCMWVALSENKRKIISMEVLADRTSWKFNLYWRGQELCTEQHFSLDLLIYNRCYQSRSNLQALARVQLLSYISPKVLLKKKNNLLIEISVTKF